VVIAHLALCVLGTAHCPPPFSFTDLTSPHGPYRGACHREGGAFALGTHRNASVDVLLDEDAPVVVRTGVAALNRYLAADAGFTLPVREWSAVEKLRPSIIAVAGRDSKLLPRLLRAGLTMPEDLGGQGFVLERLELDGVPVLVIWSPSPIGCRYGLVELARSLTVGSGSASTSLTKVISQPYFPLRISYVNFAEHLQNRYNVNVLFDTPTNSWSLDEWRGYIDMLAAMRYNVFQFWLTPTLFDRAALEGSDLTERFANTMCEVIRYAHEQGLMVEMLHTVNVAGPEWRYLCPNVPEERELILKLWSFWTRRLEGIDILGLFPGDPGGCTKNGCDYRTAVDLYAEIIETAGRRENLIYDVGTWGTPLWGWGVPVWDGDPVRARAAFDYLEARLADFPEKTFVDINLGLNSDSFGPEGGGDSEAYVREVGAIRPVATWDYAASEGEGSVIPRFRVARILERRQREAQRPYIGGINYTMTPALNQLQAFASAEGFWNPDRTVDDTIRSYSRLAFGEANEGLASQVFPFTEVSADWGGGGWHGDLGPLREGLARAQGALEACVPAREGALALFPSPAYAREQLHWYVDLFGQLARAAQWIEEARGLVAELGGPPAGEATIGSADEVLATAPRDARAERLVELVARIRQADLPALRQDYWTRVYGIYDTIERPVDPRAEGATDGLFAHFGYGFVAPAKP
jgi:hypothetical protein